MSSATSASPSPVPASASAPIDAPAKKVTRTKTTKTAAAATKVKKTAAPKKKVAAAKPVSHPSWKDMIKECIVATGGRSGVSRIALKKFAEDQYNLDATPAHISQLNRAIASGVEGGVFVLPKGPSGCVKLAPKTPRDASKENAKPASKTTAGQSESRAREEAGWQAQGRCYQTRCCESQEGGGG
ncbi:hypothetical protein B0H14DRAFT_2490055 [Mycena olivaceomarginata]|nr:hypothetical protein B0H14DRAFT_2490055 [Mycena olivaceomarginata]